MDFQITGVHFDIDEPTQNLVVKKLILPLDKYLTDFVDDLKKATVDIEKRSRWGYKVNFDLMLPGKTHIFAETTHEELVTAITTLRREIAIQLKKYKGKLNAAKIGNG